MKAAITLVALLVLALPAFAAAQDTTDSTGDLSDDVTGETGLSGVEEVDLASSTTRPVINALGVLGKGIASSPSDPMDFMIVKLGLGSVRVTIDGETRLAAVGVMLLDGVKYRLKGVSVANGQATGDIYDASDTKAGSFDVSSVLKDNVEVWAGTMALSGKTYNLYVLEGARPIQAGELREKLQDYCRNNPDDTNCQGAIADYCGNNPNDSRCKSLFRSYCLAGDNLDDTRCRDFVKGYCTGNSTLKECVALAVRTSKRYCEENANSSICTKVANELVDFCRNNPDNEGCVRAKEIVKNQPQLLSRVREFVRSNATDIRPALPSNIPELGNVDLARRALGAGG